MHAWMMSALGVHDLNLGYYLPAGSLPVLFVLNFPFWPEASGVGYFLLKHARLTLLRPPCNPPLATLGREYAQFGNADSHARKENKKGRGGAAYATQGSLCAIQAYCPTTASSTQFCLLCFQPEPIPGFLTARLLTLTRQEPCRLLAW